MPKSVAPLEWGMERSVASPEGSTARSLACNVFGVEHGEVCNLWSGAWRGL